MKPPLHLLTSERHPEVKMKRLRCAKTLDQHQDSNQEIEHSKDFQIQTLAFEMRGSTGNNQRVVNSYSSAADGIRCMRPGAEFIQYLCDMTITVDATAVDLQQNVSRLDSCPLCRAIPGDLLSSNDISGLDP